MSTIHATLTSEGDWETKILRAVRGTLHRTLFEATDTCTTEPQETGRQMQGKFWGTLQELFLRRSPFALKTVRRQMSVCPKTFAMAVRQNNHKNICAAIGNRISTFSVLLLLMMNANYQGDIYDQPYHYKWDFVSLSSLFDDSFPC